MRSLVLLSGGIDSAVALYWAFSRGWKVSTVEFEYFERPDREREACRNLRKQVTTEDSLLVPLDFIREVSDIPQGTLVNSSLAAAPQGYIPTRNLVFYSLSAYYAEILNIRYLIGGHNRTDSDSFPDAGRAFFDHFNQLLKVGMWSYKHTRTEIVLPLLEMDKVEVLNLGRSLGTPFEFTWSCYHDAERPCGACSSCTERSEAFTLSGFPDPISATAERGFDLS